MYKPNNAPTPDALLLTAREALKAVLREPDTDHRYTILMAMNTMGIAARAMEADALPPIRSGMSDDEFKAWARRAGAAEITDPSLIDGLRRHVEQKLAVSNPRFEPESPKSQP